VQSSKDNRGPRRSECDTEKCLSPNILYLDYLLTHTRGEIRKSAGIFTGLIIMGYFEPEKRRGDCACCSPYILIETPRQVHKTNDARVFMTKRQPAYFSVLNRPRQMHPLRLFISI